MKVSLKVPFERSYWVLPNKLLAGRYPGSPDSAACRALLRSLYDCGIRHIINLTQKDEVDSAGKGLASYEKQVKQMSADEQMDMTAVRLSLEQTGIPSREKMRRILDEIDLSIARKRPVYVHGWKGKNRTGMVVGCYLARRGVALGHRILSKIEELGGSDCDGAQASPEDVQQCSLIRSWRIGE